MDRVVLITGATDGLGKAVALRLASQGAQVILHGRNWQKLREVAAQVRDASNGASIRCYRADLSEIAQTWAMADEVLQHESRLDVLVNNAGVGIEHARTTTPDGLELVFQVNYLATYMLSVALTPLLRRSTLPSIVNVSSVSQQPLDFDDPQFEHNWDPIESYARSKWAQVTFSLWWAHARAAGGIAVNALHPGSLMPTKLVVGRFPVQDSLDVGVDSVVRLVVDTQIGRSTGAYFDKSIIAEPLASARDVATQVRLAALSRELCGSFRLSHDARSEKSSA